MLKHISEPALVHVEEPFQFRLHWRWQRRVLGRKHSAQTHPVISHYRIVESHILPQSFLRLGRQLINRFECRTKDRLVTLDERAAKLPLGRKVVMQARLRDTQLRSDIGIAKTVIPLGLCEPLGNIKYRRCGIAKRGLGRRLPFVF